MASKNIALIFLLIFCAVFFAGLLIGWIIKGVTQKPETSKTPQAQEAMTSRAPIPEALLHDSIVDGWQAYVEGRIIAKTDDSITIERKDRSFLIPLLPTSQADDAQTPFTLQFYRSVFGQPLRQGIVFEDISVGDYVFVTMWIKDSSLYYGFSFTVLPEELITP